MSRSTLFGSGPEVDRKWTGVFSRPDAKNRRPGPLGTLEPLFSLLPPIYLMFLVLYLYITFFFL
jgi:hypothetical protein